MQDSRKNASANGLLHLVCPKRDHYMPSYACAYLYYGQVRLEVVGEVWQVALLGLVDNTYCYYSSWVSEQNQKRNCCDSPGIECAVF